MMIPRLLIIIKALLLLSCLTSILMLIHFHTTVEYNHHSIASEIFSSFDEQLYTANSHDTSTKTSESNTKSLMLGGIIRNATDINDETYAFLSTLNCEYNVHIHILVKYGNIDTQKIKKSSSGKCGNVMIEQEEEATKTMDNTFTTLHLENENRIDNLSKLRNYQRIRMREIFISSSINLDTGVIILADLDIKKYPNIRLLMGQTSLMQKGDYTHDAICTNGVMERWSKKHKKLFTWYYDTFATVFIPDISLLKAENKLIQSSDESNSIRARLSQHLIHLYIRSRGKESENGNFSVQSCFGGLALYKAKFFFNSQCQYGLNEDIILSRRNDINSIMRYANKKDERPCEHVVFHECLRKTLENFNIAINPNLITHWKVLNE